MLSDTRIEVSAMTHSLIGADRSTHFRTIIVSIIAAVALVSAGLAARTSVKDHARQPGDQVAREASSRQ
jgi:hypothetical protein